MPDARPVRRDATDTGALPAGSVAAIVWFVYAGVKPYWNSQVVVSPLGLITPVTVAALDEICDEGPVAVLGGGCPAVRKCLSDPIEVPELLVATMR